VASMKSVDKEVEAPTNVFPLSECMWCGQPSRAEKPEQAARKFSMVKSDVASRRIARVLKHTKTQTYPFIILHPRQTWFFFGPAKSMPVWANGLENVGLAQGKSPIR